jgi:hypothetical protein
VPSIGETGTAADALWAIRSGVGRFVGSPHADAPALRLLANIAGIRALAVCDLISPHVAVIRKSQTDRQPVAFERLNREEALPDEAALFCPGRTRENCARCVNRVTIKSVGRR